MTAAAMDPQSASHDHRRCVAESLSRAEALCARRGSRLTALQREVLALVWQGHTPRSAYDILQEMGSNGRRVATLTVYRALDFLIAHGLVHRIESLNAFVGCPDPGRDHAGQFLVCKRCGIAIELTDDRILRMIGDRAAEFGFRAARPTVEVRGPCAKCQEPGQSSGPAP